MVLRASTGSSACAWSGVGTDSSAPASSRFTLLATKASGLLRSMASSIWSSETLSDLACTAKALAVSPALTVRRAPPLAATGLGAWTAGAGVLGAGAGIGAAAAGAGGAEDAGVSCTAGAKGATGSGAAGGMMSKVNSRVARPEAQLKSSTRLIKFTATGRLPLILSKARPSGKSCRLKANSV